MLPFSVESLVVWAPPVLVEVQGFDASEGAGAVLWLGGKPYPAEGTPFHWGLREISRWTVPLEVT